MGVDRSQYHSVSVSVSSELDGSTSSSDTVNKPSFAGSCILICLARARRGE